MSGKNYFKTASDLTDEFIEKEIDRGNVIATKSRNGDYICNRCGGIVDIEGDICPHCGASLYQVELQPMEHMNVGDIKPLDELVGKKKRRRAYIISAIVALALIAIGVWGGLSNRKTVIDLNQYVSVNVYGYDSAGVAEYSFDKNAFYSDFQGKIKLKDNNLEKDKNPVELLYEECISFEKPEKENRLSNGDVFSLEWKCDDNLARKKFGVILEHTTIQYAVKDLKEVGKLNPFDFILFKVEGISPCGELLTWRDDSREEMQFININASKVKNIANGDNIIFTASIVGDAQQFISRFGVMLDPVETSIQISRLPQYVDSFLDIPDETLVDMDRELQNAFIKGEGYSWTNAGWPQDVNLSMKLERVYFLDSINMANVPIKNYLYFVYEILYSNNNVNNYKYYWYGYYKDIFMDEGGSCLADPYSISSLSSNSNGGYVGAFVEPDSQHICAGYDDYKTFVFDEISEKTKVYNWNEIWGGKSIFTKDVGLDVPSLTDILE